MSLQLIPVGRTQKTHGVNGTLRIDIEDVFFEDFVAAEVLFLEVGGQQTPFFIEDRWGSGELFLKLEEIDNKEAARPLTNKVLSLRSEDVHTPTKVNNSVLPDQYAKLVGYTIFEQKVGKVGRIESIVELPQQFLAELQYQGRQIMIPLHQDLILEVDYPGKKLSMDLPEGLLDL